MGLQSYDTSLTQLRFIYLFIYLLLHLENYLKANNLLTLNNSLSIKKGSGLKLFNFSFSFVFLFVSTIFYSFTFFLLRIFLFNFTFFSPKKSVLHYYFCFNIFFTKLYFRRRLSDLKSGVLGQFL